MGDFLRRNKKKLLVLIVVLLTLPVAVYLVQQAIKLLTRATGEATTLYFSPSPVQLTATPQDVSLMLNANDQSIAFVDVTFSFDRTKVNLASEIVTSDKLTTVNSKTTMDQANQTGLVTISLGLNAADIANPPTGVFELAKMQFKAVSTTPDDTSTFTFGSKQVVNLQATELTAASETVAVTLNPTQASTAPVSGQVAFILSSGSQSITVGQNANVGFSLDPLDQSVVGTDLTVNYDPARLEIANANDVTTSSYFSQKINVTINNTLGKLSLSLLVPAEELPKTTAGEFMNIVFRSKASGTATVSLDNQSIVAGTGASGQNIAFTANSLSVNILAPTATPSPSPSPTSAPTLSPTVAPTVKPSPTAAAGTTLPTVAPTTAARTADINRDGKVDLLDYLSLFEYYGVVNPANVRSDINGDGRVDIRDYAILYEQFDR